MERIIASFKADSRLSNCENEHVGEIIINENNIEFYIRDSNNPFVHAYIGSDEHYSYTVYVKGPEYIGINNTLSYSSCYRVLYVLKSSKSYKELLIKRISQIFHLQFPN